jgi:hypothetical protein
MLDPRLGVVPGGHLDRGVSDPGLPRELAFAAPADGFYWSADWYNGFVYAQNVWRGLDIFRAGRQISSRARRLEHLNPQTQERVIGRRNGRECGQLGTQATLDGRHCP